MVTVSNNIRIRLMSVIRGFSLLNEIGNNASIGIRGFTICENKNSSNEMLPPVRIEPLDL